MTKIEGGYVVKTGDFYIAQGLVEGRKGGLRLSETLLQTCIIQDKEEALEIKNKASGDLYQLKLERDWSYI